MNTYTGFHQDKHGMAQLGRIVLDGGLFGLIPESESFAGRDLGRIQMQMEKVQAEWDKYANLPSRLPMELRERHAEIYARALVQARDKGWDPELGEDE